MPAGPNLPVGINSTDSYFQWANKILEALGIDNGKNRNSVTALIAWIAAENGQSGNNPLGCTLVMPKSQDDPNSKQSTPLQRYDSREDGVTATARTIKNYSAIVNALQRNTDYVTTARIIPTATNQDGNKWGTGPLVVTVATSIKAGGGIGGATYMQYAQKQVKATGHSAWRSVPFVGDSIANAQASVKDTIGGVADALGSVGDFLGVLTDAHTWYRIGQVLFGAIILAMGFFMLVRGSSIGSAAMQAAGAAKGIKPSGKVSAPKTGSELKVKSVEPAAA